MNSIIQWKKELSLLLDHAIHGSWIELSLTWDDNWRRLKLERERQAQHIVKWQKQTPRSIWRRIRLGPVSRPLVQLRDNLPLCFCRLTGAKQGKPSENIEVKVAERKLQVTSKCWYVLRAVNHSQLDKSAMSGIQSGTQNQNWWRQRLGIPTRGVRRETHCCSGVGCGLWCLLFGGHCGLGEASFSDAILLLRLRTFYSSPWSIKICLTRKKISTTHQKSLLRSLFLNSTRH